MNAIVVAVVISWIGLVYSQDCVDYSGKANCEYWKSTGFCQQSHSGHYCMKTCGLCTDPGTGGNNGQCGKSSVSQSRIVNGENAVPGAWPWIASLQTYNSHFCGATLLTPKWVLTASHCVDDIKASQLIVKLGAHSHNYIEPNVQEIAVKRIIMHPSYSKSTLLADIAMIELATPAILNSRVGVPCLPKRNIYPALGRQCYLAGWGSIQHPGSPHHTLQQTRLPVVESAKCQHQNEVVCVGNGFNNQPNGKQQPNACRGDSGGPLVCQQSDGSWTLEGVASYVYTYCKYYTGYSPVNKYLDWIQGYLRQ